MGVPRVIVGVVRNTRHTLNPSGRARSASMMTTSGGVSCARLTASWPVCARTTTYPEGARTVSMARNDLSCALANSTTGARWDVTRSATYPPALWKRLCVVPPSCCGRLGQRVHYACAAGARASLLSDRRLHGAPPFAAAPASLIRPTLLWLKCRDWRTPPHEPCVGAGRTARAELVGTYRIGRPRDAVRSGVGLKLDIARSDGRTIVGREFRSCGVMFAQSARRLRVRAPRRAAPRGATCSVNAAAWRSPRARWRNRCRGGCRSWRGSAWPGPHGVHGGRATRRPERGELCVAS